LRAPQAPTRDPTRMAESGGPVRGARPPVPGSGRKGLSSGMTRVMRVVRYRCVYSQAFPLSVAHGTTTMSHRRGPDHYRVTSSWLSLAPGLG